MQPVPIPEQQHEIFLTQWNIDLTILIYQGRAWFTMRQLCAALNVTNVQKQVDA